MTMMPSSHSLSLRFRLCWYRIGLSDLTQPDSNLEILSPLVSQFRWPFAAPTERPDTSIARSNAKGYDHRRHTFPGLKDRPDTSIARSNAKGYGHRRPISPGLKDRRITHATRTIPPPSIGLSDLTMMLLSGHSLPLRFRLCWYRIGLSDLHICALFHIALRCASDYAGIVMLFQSLKDRWILPRISSSIRFNPNLI
jgi:hypothetical protein